MITYKVLFLGNIQARPKRGGPQKKSMMMYQMKRGYPQTKCKETWTEEGRAKPIVSTEEGRQRKSRST